MPEQSPITFAAEIVNSVYLDIEGRMALSDSNVNILAWAVSRAGDGDHLEIGTLFGGSAIVAALVKKEQGFSGKVVCLDPLDGYYLDTIFAKRTDPVCGLPISRKQVEQNAKTFGVELEIIAKRSQPWPHELRDRKFASAYIDGDHWGDGPLLDWLNVKEQVEKIVVFDNFDDQHPDVQRAVRLAQADPEWKTIFQGGISCVMERCDGN